MSFTENEILLLRVINVNVNHYIGEIYRYYIQSFRICTILTPYTKDTHEGQF